MDAYNIMQTIRLMANTTNFQVIFLIEGQICSISGVTSEDFNRYFIYDNDETKFISLTDQTEINKYLSILNYFFQQNYNYCARTTGTSRPSINDVILIHIDDDFAYINQNMYNEFKNIAAGPGSPGSPAGPGSPGSPAGPRTPGPNTPGPVSRASTVSVDDMMAYLGQQHHGGKTSKNLRYNNRIYKLRTDKQNAKYILVNKKRVPLKDIKGKYRYVKG